MDFVGTGRRLQQDDVGNAARAIGVETAALLAFIEVEAAGRGFDAKNRPKVLFEPHVFFRNLSGAKRRQAVSAGLAYKKRGTKPYPATFDARYRQNGAAMAIDRSAALKAASWACRRSWVSAGCDMAVGHGPRHAAGRARAAAGDGNPARGLGLAADLSGSDFADPDSWRPAVKRYNGSGYAQSWPLCQGPSEAPARREDAIGRFAPGVLVKSMKGEALRNLQTGLAALGYRFTLGIDGRFGDETRHMVRRFQREHGLAVNGNAGPNTLGDRGCPYQAAG